MRSLNASHRQSQSEKDKDEEGQAPNVCTLLPEFALPIDARRRLAFSTAQSQNPFYA